MSRTARLVSVSLGIITLICIAVGYRWTRPVPRPGPVGLPLPAVDSGESREDPFGRAEWENRRLVNPRTGRIPAGIFQRERAFAGTLPRRGPDNRLPGLTDKMPGWVNRGPYNIGGRTRGLAFDVTDTTFRTLLAGGVTGGLWRTTDDGVTWDMTVGGSELHHINCITQDTRPGHENVWYYGTGEGQKTILEYGGRSHRGDGIYKSVDGGFTWSVLPSTTTGLPQTLDNPFNYVATILVDTSNPDQDEVYAATYGVVYRSVDGGDTWTAVLGDEANPGKFAEIIIDAEGVLYASLSEDGPVHGVFRSADGITWTDLSIPITNPDYGRIALGSSAANPDRVFALVAFPATSAISELFLYTHADSVAGTWSDRSDVLKELPYPYDDEYEFTYFWPQRGYNLHVAVNPTNPYYVFIGGVHLWRSTNGFADPDKVVRVGGYYYNDRSHHADQHRLIWQPGSSAVAYTATDGGVHKALHINAPNVTWTSLNHGYNTTQFYAVAVDRETPGDPVIVGGTQDNGTLWTPVTDPASTWPEIYGGDGAHCAVLDVAGGEYLVSYYRANTARIQVDAAGTLLRQAVITPDTDDTFMFINPSLIDPVDEYVLYVASDNGVLVNRDYSTVPWGNLGAVTAGWMRLTSEPAGENISALGTNAQPGHALYYGTVEGRMFRLDGALTAPAGSVPVELTGNAAFPPGSWIGGIAVHPDDDRKVLVSSCNYEVASLWYTADGGATWQDVEGNLAGADGPSVRTVAIMPLAHGDLWLAGTSIGLYSALPDSGAVPVWVQEAPADIGNVIVESLAIRPADGLIVAGTYGRGIFSVNVSPASPAPLPASRLHLAQNVPNPFNPSTEIAFTLPEAGHVDLAVFNLRGHLVKRLVNGSRPSGPNQVVWDGRNTAGRQMPSGVYLYRLRMGEEIRESRMTLVR